MKRARDNPFATDRVLMQRYRLDAQGWSELMNRLLRQKGRGALVGPKGSGKTTLLEDMEGSLASSGWKVTMIRMSADLRRLPESIERSPCVAWSGNDALLIDGAEQLSCWRWWKLRWQVRRVGVLVITVHSGRRLPVLRRCHTSPELLCGVVAALGESLSNEDAVDLHGRHRGNLRDALRELYDRWSRFSPVSA